MRHLDVIIEKVIDSTDFELVVTPFCYILTHKKIGSSYLNHVVEEKMITTLHPTLISSTKFPHYKELTQELRTNYNGYYKTDIKFNKKDFEVDRGWVQNSLIDSNYLKFTHPDYIKSKDTIIKDRNILLAGGIPSRPFIFLTRNPLQKLISGFIEDVMMSNEFAIDVDYNEFVFNTFLQKEEYLQKWIDIDYDFWEHGIVDKQKQHDGIFNETITHIGQSINWLSDLLESLNSVLPTQLQVWDINLTNLHSSLTSMGIHTTNRLFKGHIHRKHPFIKNIGKYILATTRSKLVNDLIRPNMISWSNIIKEHHTKENINLDYVLKEWSVVNKAYTTDDLFNPTTTELWCNEEHILKYDTHLNEYIRK